MVINPFQSFLNLDPRGQPKRTRQTGTGGSSVDEAAKPYIHHQANRQENKQRGGTSVAH